jgi:hypothetical protein
MRCGSASLAALGAILRADFGFSLTLTERKTSQSTLCRRWLGPIAILAVLMGSLFAQEANLTAATPRARITAAIDETQRVTLKGNTHPWAQAQFDAGPAPASLPMQRMLLVLKRSPEQQQALDQYLASVQDQNSPNFHKWLTPGQFGAHFGAAANDLGAITGWLQSHGMTVSHISRSGGTIEFSGTAGGVQAAFHTSIHKYTVNGQSHYANATDPEIPAALQPVVAGVAALHNFPSKGQAHIVGKGTGQYRHGATSQPAFTYEDSNNNIGQALVPDDLQTIYNAKPLLSGNNKVDGTGQTIAILARSDIDSYDIQQFRSLFLPFATANPLQRAYNGISPQDTDSGDTVESTADVEYASAMAPNASLLLVISASTNSDDGIALSALYAVDNNLAPVITLSYGACEAALGTSGNQFYSELWEQAAAQGITVLVASDDAGAAGCDSPDPTGDPNNPAVATQGLAVNGLASTPFNLAVGGTLFNENGSTAYWASTNDVAFGSALSFLPEEAWNESCPPSTCSAGDATFYASGGGVSTQYAKPSWQSGVGVPADGQRDLPDLALSAAGHDGYVLCFEESCDVWDGYFDFEVIGGTSLSTPSFAGVMALVNEKTGAAQGQAAPVLYNLAASQAETISQCNASTPTSGISSCIFQDVTEGNNDVPCAGGSPGCSATETGAYGILTGYSATTGYDMVTGLGSVNVANLVNQWSTGIRIATLTTVTVSPASITHGQPATLGVTVSAQTGSGTPAGDVTVTTNSSLTNAQALIEATLSNGSISGAFASLPGGSYQVSARYAGNGSFAPSTSAGVAVTVLPEASTTVISLTDQNGIVNPATVVYGAPVTLDIQSTGSSHQGIPTGTITVTGTAAGATVNAQEPLNNRGYAELDPIYLKLGQYSYAAAYPGDASFQASTSSTFSFTVVKATPTLAVTPSTTSVTATGWVHFNVVITTPSVDASFPTGTATIYSGDTPLGTVPISGSESLTGAECAVAEFTLPGGKLASGINSLTVVYNGDGNYASAQSPAVSVTLSGSGSLPGAATIVSLTVATPSGAVVNQPVRLTAAISSGAEPVEGGTVTFVNGTTVLGTVQVVGAHPANGFTTGTATLFTRLPAGSNSITARYNGQGLTYQPAASSASIVSITGTEPTTSTLVATGNAQNPGNYDLTLSVLGNGLIPAAGTANFYDTTISASLGQPSLQPAATPFTFVAAQSTAIDSQSTADGVAVIAADLNGDGIPDAITADFANNSVSVLLGNGDGTFQTATPYTVDAGPSQLLVLDVNQDGIPDIVTVNKTAGTISVLLGKGDGTFAAQQSFSAGGEPVALVAGDFNGDGIPDVAVASGSSSTVSLLLGNGDGTFQTAQSVSADSSESQTLTGLVAADFNLDGKMDLVVSATDGLHLLTGDGAGGFVPSSTQPYQSEWGVSSPVTADFNGDGIPDLALLTESPYQIAVLLGNGDGSFQSPLYFTPSDSCCYSISAHALAVADVNGDGTPDLVQMLTGTLAGTSDTSQIYVYTGTGSGDFNNAEGYALPAWSSNAPSAFAMSDLIGDGALDLLATTSGSTANALTSGLGQSWATATLSNTPSTGDTVRANYVPAQNSSYAASTSNSVVLGQRIPTTPTVSGGYWTSGNSCASAMGYSYYQGGACFEGCVGQSSGGTVAITGNITINGTRPDGSHIQVANWSMEPPYPCLVSGGAWWGWEAGTYTFTISYGGDSNYQPSVSGPYSFVVRSTDFNLALSAPTTLLAGSSAALTTNVTSSEFGGEALSLWGNVTYADGSTTYDMPYAMGSSLQYWTPPLSAGTHTITATFGGMLGSYGVRDENSATSNTVTIQVYGDTPQVGTIGLGVSSSSPAAGQPVTLTATVTQSGGSAQTKGTVTFYDGISPLGTVSLSSTGVAVFRQALAIGVHAISARYSGSVALLAASAQASASLSSTTQTVTVAPSAASSNMLAATVNADNGEAYDLAATVLGNGFTAPGGSVAFTDTTTSSLLGTVPLTTSTMTPGFSTPQTISFTGAASLVVSGDFNGNGVIDLAVADATNSAIHVLLGNGTGTFSQHDYALPAAPTALLVGDLNGDGILDLIVGAANSRVYVFLGNGDGSFQTAVSSALPVAPTLMALGDLNGDGYQDLVTLGGTTLAAAINHGDGTFNSYTTFKVNSATSNSSLIVQDLNGDGILDVLVQTGDSDYLLSGVGNGALQAEQYVLNTYGPMVAADLNGQGFPDLAYNAGNGYLGVVLGAPDGSWIPSRFYPSQLPEQFNEDIAPPPPAIAVADFNGDGIPDLIVPGLLFEGVGDGTFSATGIPAGNFTILADVNGDGVPDLIDISPTGGLTVQYGGTVITATLPGIQINGGGTHNVQAVYTPAESVPYTGSTSNVVPLQGATLISTSTTLQQALPASGNPTYGQSVTVQATIAPSSGSGTPTGSVVFTVDGSAKPGVTLSAGAAQLVLPGLAGGAHTVTAAYGGDSSYASSSTIGTLTITVQPAADTATLTSSATGSVNAGTNVTFTATIVSSAGTATPTGNVIFSDGSTQLSTIAVSSGAASYSTTTLTVGSHSITAAYSGDPNFASATSNTVTQGVTEAPVATTTTLQQTIPATGNPTYGQSVTVQATIAPASGSGTPTGSVVFTVDGSAKPGVTLSAGSAQLILSTLPGGAHSVSAAYSGDSTYGASSTSSALTITVQPAADSVSLTSSASGSINAGANVTFTATIVPAAGTAAPTGNVIFQDGTTQLGAIALSGGTAAYSTTTLTAGNHSITAAYSGDANYASATSGVVTQAVTAPAPAADFSATASPSSLTIQRGQSATTTITLSGENGYAGTVNLACGTLPAGVTCSFVPASLSVTASASAPTSVLTIDTTAATAALRAPTYPARGSSLPMLAVLSLGLPGLLLAGMSKRQRRLLRTLGMLTVMATLIGLSACGGSMSKASSSTTVAPTGTYTVPVVTLSVAGSTTHTVNLSITLQ